MARSSRSTGSRSGSARSAITGRYVTPATAARHPRTTVTNAPGASAATGTAHRSAITGRYVTPATASRHPRTTVTENG
ncbi:MAG: hypothetical protein ACRDRK_26945 [Pseudonocardia sp.]